MTLTWADLLDDFASRVEAVERALRGGETVEMPGWAPPDGDLAMPTPRDVERLRALLARADRCRLQAATAMSAAMAELAGQRVVLEAARRYAAGAATGRRRS